jgi:TRAP-type transport system periplasmic protein
MFSLLSILIISIVGCSNTPVTKVTITEIPSAVTLTQTSTTTTTVTTSLMAATTSTSTTSITPTPISNTIPPSETPTPTPTTSSTTTTTTSSTSSGGGGGGGGGTTRYTLTLNVVGQGEISLSPGVYKKTRNSTVTINAIPSEGWRFNRWEGGIAATTNTISFKMTKKITLTAVFELITYDLKYSIEQSSTSNYYLNGHKPFADAIDNATNGIVKCTIYPSESLMSSYDTWDGIKSGGTDMGWINTRLYGGKFSFAEASRLPFMFPNATISSKVTWEIFNKYPQIRAQWQENKVLATWTSDPCFLVSPNKFYKTTEDFKGLKILTTGSSQARFIQYLGGVTVSIVQSDWYEALEKGVVDSMLINADDYVSHKIYEVAPYITYIPLGCEIHTIAMNMNTWNSFSNTMQDQIISVAGETASAQFSNGVFDKPKADVITAIESTGHTVFEYSLSDNETQTFIDISKDSVWDE